MSNFDEERQNLENETYEKMKNPAKIGSKIAYKTTTTAGKKLIARNGYKKLTGTMVKGGKAVAKGLLNIGKAFILALKQLIVLFLAWGWILIPILLVVILLWILMPALKQYTFNSTNKEPGAYETNISLSSENKAMDNYFQFYSDKALTQNKVAIFYNDIDYRKSERELFDELNKKEYILGPRKPTKLVPPGNTNNNISNDNSSNNTIIGINPQGAQNAKKLIEEAQKHLGKTYEYGQKGPNKFDCSGFVYYCMNQIGIKMDYHTSSNLRKVLDYKDRSELEPGDFVFYHMGKNTTYSSVNHVAIYMGKVNGEDKIIHCSRPPGKVNIANLPTNSVSRTYTYGRWSGLSNSSSTDNSSPSNKPKTINFFTNILSRTNNNDSNNISLKKPSEITVVIDAGHGGTDTGAVGKNSKEKDINLSVAMLLEKKLKEEGYNTIMTRSTDIKVSISDRYKLSNNCGDVFISIHCNSATTSTSARGALTVYWADKDLAEYIQNGYINATNLKDRGAKHVKDLGRSQGIGVLQNAQKPAALVELAFINNLEDEKLLMDSEFQQKAANGIANGLNNYVKKVPIDTSNKNSNYDIGSTSNASLDIIKTLQEMEGFIAEETISKLQEYWESIAKPTLGWDWDTEKLRKELDKIINYSYDIKPFEEIEIDKLTYLKQEQLSENLELKDKYHREQYFNITPELLYSLNNSLYKEKFFHTNSLIKPVKTRLINGKLQLDANAFLLDNDKEIDSLKDNEDWYTKNKDLPKSLKDSISSYLIEEDKNKKNNEKNDYNNYGLGTVFVYRPIITFNIERGIEINQVEQRREITTTNKDGTTTSRIEADSKPNGKVIDNITCKIEYVLERAITFEGEYVFKYEQAVNVLEERNIEELILSDDTNLYSGTLIQSKKYEITEVPSDIVFQNKGRTYIYNYLGNFKSSIPSDLVKGFNERRIFEAFSDYVKLSDTEDSKILNNNSNTSVNKPGSSDVANVEQWRGIAEEVGNKYGIDPNLILTIINCESTGALHDTTGGYWGLSQMDKNFSGDVPGYFKDDPIYKNYNKSDIVPNCSGNSHNESEHQRVARFHIEYIGRRLSAQMGMYLYHRYGIDYRNTSLSQQQLQEAIFFTHAGYNSGEYGQYTIFENFGVDIYVAPGSKYTDMYRNAKRLNGKFIKGFNPINPKDNATYLEKAYDFFPLYSKGVSFDKASTSYNYDATKWFKHPSVSFKGSNSGGGNSGSDSNSDNISNSGIDDNAKYDNIRALKYDEYEEHGWFGEMTRFSTSLDTDKVELTLALGTAMKEEISMTSIKDANYSYWDDDYLKDNFISGLPKGRNFKDYDRGKNSNKDWKKIIDTVEYIRKNVGKNQIGAIKPLTSSAVIGHAYEVNAKINVPKSPLAIKQKIKTKITNESELQLGDILLLKSNLPNEELDGVNVDYVIDSAIFVGEENGENKFAIARNQRLQLLSISSINELFVVDSIVRPIENKYTSESESQSSNNSIIDGDYPFTAGEWAWPSSVVKISSDFGPRNVTVGSKIHKGIDIKDNVVLSKTQKGPPIYASKDGIVSEVVDGKSNNGSSGYGNCVAIDHDNNMRSKYAHLYPNTITVKLGERVKQGQIIGYMGNSGTSSGTHLHFEIKDLNKTPDSTYGQYVDPELLLTIPEGTTVYRGGGAYNLPYQTGSGDVKPQRK